MTQSARLKNEYLQNGAANQVLSNTTFERLDQQVQTTVKDKDLATPPGSPVDGDAYIVASGNWGTASSKAGQIAFWSAGAGAWQFIVPFFGYRAGVVDEISADGLPTVYGWTGSAWAISGSSGMTNPMTTAGDMIVGGASGAPARLAKGTDGQVLTMVSGAEQWATPSGNTGLTLASKSADYTLVLGDANTGILHPSADTTARTFTIPANSSVAFPVGTAISFINQNAAGTVTIAITTDTMRLAGAGSTGSRTLTANGMATALKISSAEWIISGVNLT